MPEHYKRYSQNRITREKIILNPYFLKNLFVVLFP